MKVLNLILSNYQAEIKALITGSFAALSFVIIYNLIFFAKKIWARVKFAIQKMNFIMERPFWPSVSLEHFSSWERLWLLSGFRKIPRLKAAASLVVVLSILLLILKQFVILLIMLMAIAAVLAVVAGQANGRRKLLIKEIPEALGALADAMKAGLTFVQAVELLSAELPEPIKDLFAALNRGSALKLPLGAALLGTAEQIGVREWSLAARVLARHSFAGGNILPTLAALSESLRDQEAAAGELKSLTAAGRLTGFLITALMPATLVLFSALSPSYVEALFSTVVGKMSLVLAGGLEAVGIIWIYSILKLPR